MSYGDPSSAYQSPTTSGGMQVPPEGAMHSGKKPSGLVAVSIIVLVFGIFGTFSGCIGLGFSLFSDQFSNFLVSTMEEQAAEGDEGVQQMKATFEAQAKVKWLMVASSGTGLVVSLIMLVAGIIGLVGKPAGRLWLQIALGLAILSRIFDTIVQTISSQIVNAEMQKMMQEQMGEGPVPQQSAMEMSQTIGLVFGIVFSLAVCIGYLVMLIYVTKSKEISAFYDWQQQGQQRKDGFA